MDDVAVLAAECGARSLVMLDELGRGASAREGPPSACPLAIS